MLLRRLPAGCENAAEAAGGLELYAVQTRELGVVEEEGDQVLHVYD